MSNQTTLGDLGLTDVDESDSEPPTECNEASTPTRITLLNSPANPALDAWIADRHEQDEPYGYCHLYLQTHSDLSGVEYALRYEACIDCSAVEHSYHRPTTSVDSWGGGEVETIRDWLIDWLLNHLATPYHPELRPFPKTHLRVFISDAAREYLTDHDVAIDALREQFQTLDEHTATDEYLSQHRERRAIREWLRGDDGLKTHKHWIEATIRARFGFTARYNSHVPDPHPVYEPLSLDALRDCLKRIRAQIMTATDRRDDLREALSSAETAWIDQTKHDHFEE